MVDCRLISETLAFSFIPEPFQYIGINKDRNSRLAFIGYHRPTVAIAEVVGLGGVGTPMKLFISPLLIGLGFWPRHVSVVMVKIVLIVRMVESVPVKSASLSP
jgi:hypothetical protein